MRWLATIFTVLPLLLGTIGHAEPPWRQLPPTPTLPAPLRAGRVTNHGAKLWYAVFGRGSPVVLVHGGLANASYWGHQIPVLARHHQVVVLDSRGHGRSTRSQEPIGYDLMASDVLALLDHLKIRKAAFVGWSDGAIIGLDIAIHHPERLSRLFAFAANSDPSGVKDTDKSPVFRAFVARTRREYQQLSPTPGQYDAFLRNIEHMWASEPHFTAAQLEKITVPTWIVDADHDEAIRRENTDFMFHHIPGAEELILPGVSHFAMLQNPAEFNAALLRFLRWQPARGASH